MATATAAFRREASERRSAKLDELRNFYGVIDVEKQRVHCLLNWRARSEIQLDWEDIGAMQEVMGYDPKRYRVDTRHIQVLPTDGGYVYLWSCWLPRE